MLYKYIYIYITIDIYIYNYRYYISQWSNCQVLGFHLRNNFNKQKFHKKTWSHNPVINLSGPGIHGGLRFVPRPHYFAAGAFATAAGRRGPRTAGRQAAGALGRGDTPVRAPKKIAGLTPENGWNMTVKMQLSPGKKNGKMRRRLVNMGVDHVLPVNMRI